MAFRERPSNVQHMGSCRCNQCPTQQTPRPCEGLRISQRSLPRHDLPPQPEIAHEAIHGMLKGRRAVVLEEEVACPCKAVANQRHEGEHFEAQGQQRQGVEGQDDGGAQDVQAPACPIRMLPFGMRGFVDGWMGRGGQG